MGSSSRVTVGYRYFMGLHFGVCYGPVDALKEIRAGDRQAWVGSVTDNETISIDKPSLFGGKKREGGIEGDLDVMMGGPAQTANSYLASKIAGLMPAFRGVLSLVYKGGLISANNPYIKPWAFLVERIKQSWEGGTAWNPTKAAIELGSSEIILEQETEGWDYQIIPHHADPGFSGLDIPDDGWTEGAYSPFAGGTLIGDGNTEWPIKTILWARYAIDVPSAVGMSRRLYVQSENGSVGFINGEIVGGVNRENVQTPDGIINEWEVVLQEGTVNQIAIKAFDETSPVGGGTLLTVQLSLDSLFNAMNPAHIIYQCLTDPQWGMGYPTAQIDETSFAAAADTFFNEGLGLCLIWNQQSSIEDFVQSVLDHAGAVYYADPKTGKFKLKALRADYDPDYLPVYDENSIISVDNYQRPGYGETINEITVVYREYGTAKDASITVQDLANIQAQGGVVSQTRQYPGLPTPELAARIAERDVIASSTPLARCRITVNRSAWEEAPGEVIKVNWDKLGVDGVIFRVLTINYGTLTQGQLVIELAEDVYGLPSSSYSIQQVSGFVEPDVTPSPITIQTSLEAPYWDIARALTAADLSFLSEDSAFVMSAASTENDISLGFEMHTRISPAEYASADGSGTFAPTALIAGSNGLRRQDTFLEYESGINIADVVVGQRALIGSGSFAEFVEIVDITSIPNEFEVNRGILDTTPQDHVVGTRIFFIEDDFAVDPTERATGDSVDIKLTAFSGGGETSLGAAITMNVEPDQRLYRPYPPGKVRIDGEDFPDTVIQESSGTVVEWAHRDRLQQLVSYVDQDEDSIGPEAGTTYTVRFYLDSALVNTQTGITGTLASYIFESDGVGRVEIDSVRDGVINWQSQIREFDVFTEVETDPNYASVVSLLHMNGADGSTTFTDEKGITWSTAGNVQIDTAQFKFGGASMLCDGTGDYIAHASALLTTADFTLEGWFRFNALGAGVRSLWSQYLLADANRTIFDIRNALLSIFNGAQGLQSGSTTLVTGQWYHIAFVRQGTTCKGYVDGVLEVTHSTFQGPANVLIRLGSFDGTGNYYDGWIDECRITVGVARYTANFTPPDAPFPDS